MGAFIQYQTKDSLYNGEFGGKAGWPAAGMGNVIVTDGGKLIAVDGGNPNDGEAFLNLLWEKAGGKKPVVEHWILTHPHADHYGALQSICHSEEMLSRVQVKELVYWFPEEFKDKAGNTNVFSAVNAEMEGYAKLLGARRRIPRRDERLLVDETEICFLHVPDDCSIFAYHNGNYNLCSLIFTVKGGKRKVTVTGDAFRPSLQITAFRYGKTLKCDVLQMPHHSLCDAYCEDFYQFAAPETVLMPISRAGYRAMHSGDYDTRGAGINLALENSAQRVYKAFEGTAEIEI